MDSTIERADEDQGGTVRILPHGTTAAPAGPLADGTRPGKQRFSVPAFSLRDTGMGIPTEK
jgi:hypothetical protein